MKDIYELLNDAEIDLDEFEESSLDDLYRKKIKKRVHKEIWDRKSLFVKGSKIVIVFLCIMLSTTFISYKISPAFATSIPLVGSIIKEITGYNNALFDQYTSVINKSVEVDGIKITLNEVMLDRNQLRIAATSYSGQKIYDYSFHLNQPEVLVNGKMLRFSSGSGIASFIDDHTLVSVDNLDVHEIKIPSNINMQIRYENISYEDETGEHRVVEGPWIFEFSVSKSSIESKTKTYKLNKDVISSDVEMHLEDITITPLTTYMKYTYRGNRPISFLVVDENGIALREEGSGYGTGSLLDQLFGKNRGEVNYSAVAEDAKELTIIPYYRKRELNVETIRTEPVRYTGRLPFELEQNEGNKIIIYNLERRDGRVYIDFKTEGVSYALQGYRLFLYDDQAIELESVVTEESRYDVIIGDQMLTTVFEDHPGSILYLGTDTMADIEVFKEAEFKINLGNR